MPENDGLPPERGGAQGDQGGERGTETTPGRDRPERSGFWQGVSWRWVLLSIPVVLLVQIAMSALALAVAAPSLLPFFALIAYYLGGMLVGRLSPGVTIKEPAIAAGILIVVLGVVQAATLPGEVPVLSFLFQLLFGLFIAFGLTWLGARTGERLPGSRRLGGGESRP